MLSQKEIKSIEDIIGDNHISTSTETPLRKDAFKISNEDKIKLQQLILTNIRGRLLLTIKRWALTLKSVSPLLIMS